jgi:aspartyl-tRNA(Asn)/glutamyl-tRNA(Gln) amidotransferase subunit C
MEALSREKVLHVAELGKIEVSEEEIEKFAVGLKQILYEIEKVNNLNIDTEDFLITPTDNTNTYSDDIVGEMLDVNDALKNAPSKRGNFVEVVRVVND